MKKAACWDSSRAFGRIPVYLPFSLGVLWLWSGLQPVLTAPETSLDLLAAVGIAAEWRRTVLLAASLWDVALGIACFTRMRGRPWLWAAQLFTVVAYSAIVAVALPENWLHPFAPLLKNLPIAALMYFLWRHTAAMCVDKE